MNETVSGKQPWNGMCPTGKHGLDFEGQACDVCAHDDGVHAGKTDRRNCRACHATWARRLREIW